MPDICRHEAGRAAAWPPHEALKPLCAPSASLPTCLGSSASSLQHRRALQPVRGSFLLWSDGARPQPTALSPSSCDRHAGQASRCAAWGGGAVAPPRALAATTRVPQRRLGMLRLWSGVLGAHPWWLLKRLSPCRRWRRHRQWRRYQPPLSCSPPACPPPAGPTTQQAQIVCSGCHTVLLFPAGAQNVRCARCSAITSVAPPPPPGDMAQLCCSNAQCRVVLMYPRGAGQASKGAGGAGGGLGGSVCSGRRTTPAAAACCRLRCAVERLGGLDSSCSQPAWAQAGWLAGCRRTAAVPHDNPCRTLRRHHSTRTPD